MYTVGLAAMCWLIWKARNSVRFEGKRVKSPTEIVCMVCFFSILRRAAAAGSHPRGATRTRDFEGNSTSLPSASPDQWNEINDSRQMRNDSEALFSYELFFFILHAVHSFTCVVQIVLHLVLKFDMMV